MCGMNCGKRTIDKVLFLLFMLCPPVMMLILLPIHYAITFYEKASKSIKKKGMKYLNALFAEE